jgi:hypothetical protein
MIWLTNPGTGKIDTMLTLGVYTTVIVLFKFLFSEMSFGPITFGQLDGGVVTALLAPTLGAYVARRYSDNMAAKKDSNDNSK